MCGIKPQCRSKNTDTNHGMTKPWVAQLKDSVPKTAISIHPVFTNYFLQNHLIFGLASDRSPRCFLAKIL